MNIIETDQQRMTNAAVLHRLTRREAHNLAQKMHFASRRDGAMEGLPLPPEAESWAKSASEALSAVFVSPDGEPFRFTVRAAPFSVEDKSASVSWTASTCDVSIFCWPACVASADERVWPALFLFLICHDYCCAVKQREPEFDFGGVKNPAETLFKDAATTTPAQRAKAAAGLWN